MQKLSYRILLVEDDADDRYIMHQAFKETGLHDHVKMFGSGKELLNYLSLLSPEAFPELIVLDYNMPALNGGELAMQLKKHPLFESIPVALYSTGMNPRMQEQLLFSGVVKCFDKGMEYRDSLRLVLAFRELVDMKVHQQAS